PYPGTLLRYLHGLRLSLGFRVQCGHGELLRVGNKRAAGRLARSSRRLLPGVLQLLAFDSSALGLLAFEPLLLGSFAVTAFAFELLDAGALGSFAFKPFAFEPFLF